MFDLCSDFIAAKAGIRQVGVLSAAITGLGRIFRQSNFSLPLVLYPCGPASSTKPVSYPVGLRRYSHLPFLDLERPQRIIPGTGTAPSRNSTSRNRIGTTGR